MPKPLRVRSGERHVVRRTAWGTVLLFVLAFALASVAFAAGGDDADLPVDDGNGSEANGEANGAESNGVGPNGADGADGPAGAAADSDAETADGTPGLVSFGVALGLPSYRTVSGSAAFQAGAFGAEARVGYGPGAGGSVGLTGRFYPPLPGLPVPVWVGGGGAWTGAGLAPHVAAGVHVPVAQRWRIDAEAGVAWPRLGFERHATPHLSVGVSYAFAVDLDGLDAASGGSRARRTGVGPSTACDPEPPDPSRLDQAARRTAQRFLDDARATYGSLYRDLSWSLDVVRTDVRDDVATVVARYDGSVREIASGERIHASGEATGTYRWTGCGWRTIGFSYG